MTVSPALLTLGVLQVRSVDFRREKPLLLLAYLSLRGVQERRALARLFWPDASDPMNSLSVALGQLRRAGVPFHATDTQVSTPLGCDVPELLARCAARDLAGAQQLYRGAFAAGVLETELSDDLRDWLTATRERCAEAYRSLLLDKARRVAVGDPGAAGEWAALAYAVAGAAPPEPATFQELHALLRGADHLSAALLEREAAALKVTLPDQSLPGRQWEVQRLAQVQPGETLWVRGPAGIGKTALLQAVRGTLLRGQSGRPFATLRSLPDLPGPPPADERQWLQELEGRRDPLLLDDWEACDPESRRVFLTLAGRRTGPPLVLSSVTRPLVALPELNLRPLTGLSPEEQALTGGLPALLHAARHDLPLADAFTQLLSRFGPRARQVLACLGVQRQPDLQVTQAALELSAEDMAVTLEGLRAAFLLDDHGRPGAPGAWRAWLDAQPSLETEVLTLLAPHLPVQDALPLYLRAHALTGASDFPGFQAALAEQARALLGTDRHVETHELLRAHARTPETSLLLARALDGMGRHREALTLLRGLPATPLTQVYQGRAVWRLGDRAQATALAQAGLGGDMEARAQAHDLLASLALAAQAYGQAQDHAQRSAGLFLLLGDELMRLKLVCTQAVAAQKLGQDVTPLLRELREAGADQLPPIALLNIGYLLMAQGEHEDALTYAMHAAVQGGARHDLSTAAAAWINVGVLHHTLQRTDEATRAYGEAIRVARQGGEVRLLGLALGNLAELQRNLPLIEEALGILEGAGHEDLAAYFREQRSAFLQHSGGG